MDQPEVTISSGPDAQVCAMNVPPIVVWKNYITIGGHPVHATFDLTDLPKPLHGWASVMIRRGSTHLKMQCDCNRPPEAEPEPLPRWMEKIKTGWRTVFRRNKNHEQQEQKEGQ